MFTGRTSVSAHGHRRFPRGVATRGLCSASSTSPRGGAPLFLSPLLVPSTPAVSCWALWFFKLNLSFRKSGESSRPPVPPCVCWGDVGQAAPRAQLGSRPSPAHSCGSVGTGGGHGPSPWHPCPPCPSHPFPGHPTWTGVWPWGHCPGTARAGRGPGKALPVSLCPGSRVRGAGGRQWVWQNPIPTSHLADSARASPEGPPPPQLPRPALAATSAVPFP